MKRLYGKFVFAGMLIISSFFISCGSSNKNNVTPPPADETAGMTKIQDTAINNYTFSFYLNSDSLRTGYNEIYIQIKDNSTGQYVNNATSLSWSPAFLAPLAPLYCPCSSITKAPNTQTLYEGFIIFQMNGYCNIPLKYSINGQSAQMVTNLYVANSPLQTVQTFTGNDGNDYLLAMVKPDTPTVGANKMSAYLYTTQDWMTYTPVTNDTVKVNPTMPTMPGMGYTMPGNKDLTYNGATGLYEGQVSFSMSGYWLINMMLVDNNGQTLYGNALTSGGDSSSLHFQIQF